MQPTDARMTPDTSGTRPSRFSSPRERRLWIWTAVAVAGVYSTLPLAAILSDVLYHQGAAAVAFLAAMALVGATVLTEGLTFRPRGLEIGIALGIAAVYMMVLVRMAIPERSHLIEYGVVAVLVFEALHERARSGRRVPAPWFLAIVATALVGAVDEAIQLLLPHRTFDTVDILFNLMAAVAAVLSMATIRWAKRRSARAGRTSA